MTYFILFRALYPERKIPLYSWSLSLLILSIAANTTNTQQDTTNTITIIIKTRKQKQRKETNGNPTTRTVTQHHTQYYTPTELFITKHHITLYHNKHIMRVDHVSSVVKRYPIKQQPSSSTTKRDPNTWENIKVYLNIYLYCFSLRLIKFRPLPCRSAIYIICSK